MSGHIGVSAAVLFNSKFSSQDDLESTLHGKTTFPPVSTSLSLFSDSNMCKRLSDNPFSSNLYTIYSIFIGGFKKEREKERLSEIGVFTKNKFYC